MATSYKDIFDAIIARIKANWTTTAIHYPATHFKPNPTARWIQPRIHWDEAAQVSLGQNGHNRITGDLQIQIFAPVGNGADEAHTYADTLRGLFPRGLALLAGSRTITFEVPEVQQAIEDEDWYQLPVVCPFYFDEVQ